jgi:hypothetical protein
MSEPNVLVSFRLDKDSPVRFRWLATDGVPGDGYKAQITAIKLAGGGVLEMDGSSIVEQTAPDAAGGLGAYLLTFSGMVGYASDHPSRKQIDKLADQQVEYDLSFVHDHSGRVAIENEDYKIIDRPRGWLRKLSK